MENDVCLSPQNICFWSIKEEMQQTIFERIVFRDKQGCRQNTRATTYKSDRSTIKEA